jgi:hypothetical protein
MQLSNRRICFTAFANVMGRSLAWIEQHLGKINNRKKEEYMSCGFKGTLVDFDIVESYVNDWGLQDSVGWRCLVDERLVVQLNLLKIFFNSNIY